MTKKEKEQIKDLLLGTNDADETIDEEIEIKGKIIRVHNDKVRSEITSDVILATWKNDKDRKFVLDLAVIAGDSLHQVKRYYTAVERYYTSIGKKELLNEQWEHEKELRLRRISDIFMRRIDWLCALHRNEADNHLVKELLQSQIADKIIEEPEGMTKELKDLKKSLSNQEKTEK